MSSSRRTATEIERLALLALSCSDARSAHTYTLGANRSAPALDTRTGVASMHGDWSSRVAPSALRVLAVAARLSGSNAVAKPERDHPRNGIVCPSADHHASTNTPERCIDSRASHSTSLDNSTTSHNSTSTASIDDGSAQPRLTPRISIGPASHERMGYRAFMVDMVNADDDAALTRTSVQGAIATQRRVSQRSCTALLRETFSDPLTHDEARALVNEDTSFNWRSDARRRDCARTLLTRLRRSTMYARAVDDVRRAINEWCDDVGVESPLTT